MLDAGEILAGIRALARERKQNRMLMWIVGGLVLFLIILLAAQTGLMFKVIEVTKDTKFSGDKMTVKSTSQPVQVQTLPPVANSLPPCVSSTPHPALASALSSPTN